MAVLTSAMLGILTGQIADYHVHVIGQILPRASHATHISLATIYGKVRSWIDPARLVPLRIEKYSASGELLRRIDTTRVAQDERHHPIPAYLVVHGPRRNSVTELNGVRIDQDVTFTEADFTPAAFLK